MDPLTLVIWPFLLWSFVLGQMTAPERVAWIMIIPPTVASVGALMVAVFNGMITRENNRIAKETLKETKEVGVKSTEIHTATNGTLHEMQGALKVALEKVDGLEKLVRHLSEAKAVADTLATAGKAQDPSEPAKFEMVNPPERPANVQDVSKPKPKK